MAKKKPEKYRNPLVVPAKRRGSSGPMRPKKDKRKNGKNKKQKYLNEDY